MPSIPEDPVKKATITRVEYKEMEKNLQRALDDAIERGVLTMPLNAAISKLIAHLRVRQQVAAF